MTVKTCSRCLYTSSHPLGLVIDEQGICSGCRIHEEKNKLDWNARWQELEKIVKEYRTKDNRNYDCIVPVTGAGDSHFIVHTVVNRLKLKPLLVTHNRYYNTPLGIRNLSNLRRTFNADLLAQNVNPYSVKKIIKTTLRKFGSFHWPAIAGQTVFPVQTAVSHKIPLIIWGAHQGLEQVGMFSHLHNPEMTRRYRKDHDLMGYEADDLMSIFDNLKETDIWQYRYPEWNDIKSNGVRGIYLGNYVRWDPLAQHIEMTNRAGYHSAKMSRTFDIYDHVDDWHYINTHDWIKQKKHGYSKCLDQCCREIRHGRLSREQALKIVEYYEDKEPQHSNLLLEWLGIPKDALNHIIVEHQQENQKTNYEAITDIDQILRDTDIRLIANDRMGRDKQAKHVIVGKGYPD